MIADEVRQALVAAANNPTPEKVAGMNRFFKSYEGGYSHGDQFLGITVPVIRMVAKKYASVSLDDIEQLLASPWHEVRELAAIILVMQTKRASLQTRKQLCEFYLNHTAGINNWDIVDTSCRDVVGEYLLRSEPAESAILQKLAMSADMWERRIAMVSTWAFIRQHQLDHTFTIATQLIHDKQDLIHKAVGWMLREAGKRDEVRLKEYLNHYASQLPRTALRYAIERFTPEERARYLAVKRSI